MKRLLLDLSSLDTPSRRRGTGRYVRDLAVGLSRLPSDVLGDLSIVGLTHLEPNGSFRVTDRLDDFAGSPHVELPTARDHYHWAYARRLGLFRAVRHMDVQAIHLGDPHATPLFMGVTGCRRIVTCHDAIPMHFPKRYMGWRDGGPWLGTAIERRRYRSADLVVAISDATLKDVVEIHRVPRERVVRVYNGVDIERWAREPSVDGPGVLERFGLRRHGFALYVGGYHWHKNVEAMLSGVAAARSHGLDLSFVWAGQLSEEHAQHIRSVAAAVGAADALKFLAYVSDEEVSVLYRAALAHTLLSRWEGFGLTAIEAMASGCPLVATRGGSLAEIAGDAAVSVEPDDHDAVGNALIRLAMEPQYRDDLVERGRVRAGAFSLDAQARAMAQVYRNFLQV
jgi:glycosyltransferase involved in cell wall biosynthesis